MEIISLTIPDIKWFSPKIYQDKRGYFFESFRKSWLEEEGIFADFPQENCSLSCKNTLRGMHFQSFPGQGKLLHVSQGEIWDVAVDIRPHSAFFKQYVAVKLSEKRPSFLWIPPGFAHGFLVLQGPAKVHYKVSAYYQADTEKGFRYDDTEIQIDWPLSTPILSERDQMAPTFQEVMSQGVL